MAADPPISAAILDFQTSSPKLEGKGSEVAILLNAKLSSSPRLALVERHELGKLLSEQGIAISGVANPLAAAKIGQISGAKILVTGRIIESGARYILVAKIMSVETSRVFGETALLGDLDAMDAAVADLGRKIEDVVAKQSGALVAKVEEKGARLERLRGMLKEKKLPSVRIEIAEQQVNRPTPDPAAEMEFKTVLRALGFEIVEGKQAGVEPDVIIRGSGFSEFSGRRESLISCRARLEVEVARRADGKLIYADRETASAVDLAEQIAGKTALQEAAFTIIERMLPTVVGGIAK